MQHCPAFLPRTRSVVVRGLLPRIFGGHISICMPRTAGSIPPIKKRQWKQGWSVAPVKRNITILAETGAPRARAVIVWVLQKFLEAPPRRRRMTRKAKLETMRLKQDLTTGLGQRPRRAEAEVVGRKTQSEITKNLGKSVGS